jgi:uncharacterized membrane protein YbaN (DUF454 family)
MAKSWGSYKAVLGKGGLMNVWGSVCWILGFIFAVLGAIGGVLNAHIGLAPTYWMLLSIAAFTASISWYIAWAVALYFDATAAKRKRG